MLQELTQTQEMNSLISWLGSPPRNPHQIHGLNESDCEILDLQNGSYLAATIDSISEELLAGLYEDPYTIGWMTVVASLSDLSAVGASPLGMLISTEWDHSFTQEKKTQFGLGLSDALRVHHSFLLGGDTGFTRSAVMSGVALGFCHSRPLSRIGMKPGDHVCIIGKIGNGPALALRHILEDPKSAYPESLFRPVAKIQDGIRLRSLASSSIDISDGVFSSLETLQKLNGFHFDLFWNPEILCEPSLAYVQNKNLPEWLLLASQHGDYQLLVTIPDSVFKEAKKQISQIYPIGRVSKNLFSTLQYQDQSPIKLNLEEICQISSPHQKSLRAAISNAIEYGKTHGFL